MASFTAVLKSGEGFSQPVIVSYTDAKQQLNITHDHQQALIESYIEAAVQQAENYTSRSLKTYSVTATAEAFIDNLVLENTPLISDTVVVKYYDESNQETTLPDSNYVINYVYNEPVIVYNDFSALPNVYDRKDAVVITYESGYATTADVPASFSQFVKLLVSSMYEYRSDSVDKFPRYSYSLIRSFKKWE